MQKYPISYLVDVLMISVEVGWNPQKHTSYFVLQERKLAFSCKNTKVQCMCTDWPACDLKTFKFPLKNGFQGTVCSLQPKFWEIWFKCHHSLSLCIMCLWFYCFKMPSCWCCRWDLILTTTYVSLAFLQTCQAFLVENRMFPVLLPKVHNHVNIQ